MTQVLIVEDDKDSREALKQILLELSESLNICTASGLAEAEHFLNSDSQFDLFLLDVNLIVEQEEDISGITFAREVRAKQVYEFTPLVMITSVPAMEMEAYRELHCYQYILKPFEKADVQAVVKKVIAHPQEVKAHFVIVKKEGINYRIEAKDIVYCRAIERGVCLYLQGEQMKVPYLSIRHLLEKLPQEQFIQCHRMFVVNKKYVEYFDLVNQIIKVRGYPAEIDIGVTYKEKVRRQMNE